MHRDSVNHIIEVLLDEGVSQHVLRILFVELDGSAVRFL